MLIERGATGISHLTFTFGGSNPEIEIAEPLAPRSPGHPRPRRDRRRLLLGQPALRVHRRAPRPVRETYEIMVSIVDDVGAMLVPGHHPRRDLQAGARAPSRARGRRRWPGSRTPATTSASRPRSAGSPTRQTRRSSPGWRSTSSSTRTLETVRPDRRRGDLRDLRRRPRAPDRAPAGDPGGRLTLGAAAARFGSGSSDSGSSARPTSTDTSRPRAASSPWSATCRRRRSTRSSAARGVRGTTDPGCGDRRPRDRRGRAPAPAHDPPPLRQGGARGRQARLRREADHGHAGRGGGADRAGRRRAA